MKVVIVGAGVAGLAVAHALVERGVRPLVIAPDHGFTRNGAGIVTSQFWDAELQPLARRSQQILRRIVRTHECAMAQIALAETTALLLDGVEGGRDGLPAALRPALSVAFRRRIVRAVHARDDFWLSPAELLRALARGSRRVRARALAIRPGRIETDAGVFEADAIVVATGAWRAPSLPPDGLERRRAQLARSPWSAPAMFHVLDSGLYVRPAARGSLVGDGDARWRGAPSEAAVRATPRFMARAHAELASLLGSPAVCRPAPGGLVAMTSDRRPLVRRAGRTWLLTGFGGDGLSLAPAYGERLADDVLGS